MNTTAHPRKLRDVVHDMFQDVVPERTADLQRYWGEFSLQFEILDDNGADGPVVLDAGGYVKIRFNHRIMRLFWLGSFAMWEGYCAFQYYTTTQKSRLARFSEILDCFEATRVANDVDALRWPDYLPSPGNLVDHTAGDPARLVGELAIFGVSWALLHELQHLVHQQAETSAAWDDGEACRKEEHLCDAFATNFLLERIAEHAASTGESQSLISDKRQLGIYSAVFTMTLLSRDSWGPGRRHPALQDRIDAIVAIVEEHRTSKVAAIVGFAAFVSLKLAYPDAPDPFEAVDRVAQRRGWKSDDPIFDD